jgi:predicted hotdog family 3-hydroxylacyl-ACP dehydratase
MTNYIDYLIDIEEITQFIPHRDPFVMVDRLLEYSPEKVISDFQIRPNNILVTDGYFQEAGIIENIAQTVALHFGYEATNKKMPPRVGFIAAIKNFKLFNLVPIGQALITTTTVTHNMVDVLIVRGESEYLGIPVASCEMRLFLEKTTNI